MKYTELNVEQLKKELSKLVLSTSGTKTELQKRLMEELQHQGLDIARYDFKCKDQVKVCCFGLKIKSKILIKSQGGSV